MRANIVHEDGRTDRRADMRKLKVAFRNFAKAPERKTFSCCICDHVFFPVFYMSENGFLKKTTKST